MIAKTPRPPYYAVIFTSIKEEPADGYAEMAEFMEALAQKQPGYLGIESARDKVGITVSYWKDLESIKNWKRHAEHRVAQEKGKSHWYKSFKARIAKVERDYDFHKL